MQPPRLAAITHGKLSSRTCPKSSRVRNPKVQPLRYHIPSIVRSRTLLPSLPSARSHLVFLLFKTTRHGCLAREIST